MMIAPNTKRIGVRFAMKRYYTAAHWCTVCHYTVKAQNLAPLPYNKKIPQKLTIIKKIVVPLLYDGDEW